MPTTNTPATNGAFSLTQTHPSDGDPATAESANLPLRQLGDMDRFLLTHAAMALCNLDFAGIVDTVDTKSMLRHIYDAGTETSLHDACWAAGAGANDEGMYVAVGHGEPQGTADAGLILYSYDGAAFTAYVHTAQTAQFYGICHGGPGASGSKVFVYTGATTAGAGRVYYAADSDPTTLTQWFTGSVSGAWRSAAWNGNVWCIVGGTGAIVTATDAQRLASTFTVRTAAAAYAGTWRKVYANGSILIAFGDDGEIQRSTDDGVTWTQVHSDATLGSLTQVLATSAGLLVGTNKSNTYLLSTDSGATWTEYTCAPTGGATLGAVVSLAKIGLVTLAIVETSQGNLPMVSYDGGLTWPALTNFSGRASALEWRASATDGLGAVIVGGTADGTTYGTILRTPRRAAFHGL